MSKPLFSALASAPWRILRMLSDALMGYRPANAWSSPCRCPAFFWYRRNGTAFFFSMTSRRYVLAWVSIIPLIVVHTSRACLWDTLISRPLAFTVFSGSSSSVNIEYPHFGMCISPTAQFNSVNANYKAFHITSSFSTKSTD